jgi:hypothetical protein
MYSLRSCASIGLIPAMLGVAVVAACDDAAAPGSRSDGGDAAADQASSLDQAAADVHNPAACGMSAPTSGDSCTLDASTECIYRGSCPANGKPRDRLCVCTDGKWSCIQDLGCGLDEPALAGPPAACQGSCQVGAASCSYVVEKCPAAEDLQGTCTCSNGTWSCSRAYDCYRPNTCHPPDSHVCVTNGLAGNTGNFCPQGFIQGPCVGNPCQLGTWSQRRPCRNAGGHQRSAACVYGQWTCPIGYSAAVLLL